MEPSMGRIRVDVEHDAPLVAIGINAVLGQHGDMDVRLVDGTTASDIEPDILVADYASGLKFANRQERARGRDARTARVLVVTANDREHDVFRALEAGVDGYMELGCDANEVVMGVRQLARGSRYLSATAARRVAESLLQSRLTNREDDVLRLISVGESNKAIAARLEISVGTVKAHVKTIMGKLNARSRTEAASIALGRGLVPRAPFATRFAHPADVRPRV